ncbi:MAG TPA: toll/interleukin-1 receptor domain-containing protein [Bacillota bacterium]|nr:toll/interleukin-1 receptor domain-containing protein [Bacillota bacterium]HRU02136.1 toll/interleukin-1 receptor domain-containing protein [Victivallales bacterium]
MRLFFGCSKEDRELVDSLMAFLNKMYEIDLEQMYNCYVGRNIIPTGVNFNDYIRKIITECDRAIIMITPGSLKRRYCLCELGAAWGLDKNITLILVAPCKFEDLLESPLMGIQAWFVDLRDKESISEFVENIKRDTDLSKISRKINLTQKIDAETEFKETLFNIGQIHAELPPLPDYTRCYAFHADGNSNTLRILQSDNERIRIKIDFSTSNPNYVGFYFDLRDTDWTGLIANNSSLSFRVDALRTIKAMKVEFKNRFPDKELTKIGEYIVDLTKNSREVNICLRDVNDIIGNWRHMRELTFVFENSDIEEMGTFTVSNMSFVHTPRP